MNGVALARPANLPELVAAAGDRARIRFLEFFTGQHPQPAHAPAYGRAAEEFWRGARAPACCRSPTRNQYTLPPELRPVARARGADHGEPCVDADDAALRSAPRGADAR